VAGGVLYFAAYGVGTTGDELWRSDGTQPGTQVLDIDTQSSYPDELTEAAGSLYFAADHGAYGRELWRAVPNGGDTVPPETTITSGPANGSTIPSGTSAVFTFTGTPGNTAWFECALDDDPVILCKSPFTWTGDRLGKGSHTFRVRAFNSVGNPDPTWAQRTFTSGAVAAPSSAFNAPTGGKADTRKGTLALGVKLPGPGRLTLGPSGSSPVKKVTATSSGAGTTTIVLKLTKPGMKQLKKKLAQAIKQGKKVGKLKVKVALTFLPSGGDPRTKTASYVVKLKK
jgi:ELWxxDGT repeat protein